MIKILNLKVKLPDIKNTVFTRGFDFNDGQHGMVVWKPWVGFCFEYDYIHYRILNNDFNLYDFMLTMLKIGDYIKADIPLGIPERNGLTNVNQEMLSQLTGIHRETVKHRLLKLQNLGYIDYQEKEKKEGRGAEEIVYFLEKNKEGYPIFSVKNSWRNESLNIDIESVACKVEDIKDICVLPPVNLLKPKSKTSEYVEPFDISTKQEEQPDMSNHSTLQDLDMSNHSTLQDKESGNVEPIDIPPNHVEPFDISEKNENALNFETSLEKIEQYIYNFTNFNVNVVKDANTNVNTFNTAFVYKHHIQTPGRNDPAPAGESPVIKKGATTTSSDIVRTKVLALSLDARALASFYESETGLKIEERDIECFSMALKTSTERQARQAILNSKNWKNGFFLKKCGMRMVLNFISKNPKYQKESVLRKKFSTRVRSGINRKRAGEQGAKIIAEAKRQVAAEKEKKTTEAK